MIVHFIIQKLKNKHTFSKIYKLRKLILTEREETKKNISHQRNNPWERWVKEFVGPHIPGYTTTVQPPTTTKKDTSLIEYVAKTINNFRKEMINGNGTLGIPKMEPWTFQKSKLDME